MKYATNKEVIKNIKVKSRDLQALRKNLGKIKEKIVSNKIYTELMQKENAIGKGEKSFNNRHKNNPNGKTTKLKPINLIKVFFDLTLRITPRIAKTKYDTNNII